MTDEIDGLFLYKAYYLEQFLGSLTAEVGEGEELVEARSVECGIDRAVGCLVHVDAVALVDVRVAPHGLRPLRLGEDEELVVVVGLARSCASDGAPIHLTRLHPLVVPQLRLQVDT